MLTILRSRAIANDQKQVLRVEWHFGQLALFLLRHDLDAQGLILVHVQIKNMNTTIGSDCSQNCAGIGRPSHVLNWRTQIKLEQGLSK